MLFIQWIVMTKLKELRKDTYHNAVNIIMCLPLSQSKYMICTHHYSNLCQQIFIIMCIYSSQYCKAHYAYLLWYCHIFIIVIPAETQYLVIWQIYYISHALCIPGLAGIAYIPVSLSWKLKIRASYSSSNVKQETNSCHFLPTSSLEAINGRFIIKWNVLLSLTYYCNLVHERIETYFRHLMTL